jgi:hypothetical protein
MLGIRAELNLNLQGCMKKSGTMQMISDVFSGQLFPSTTSLALTLFSATSHWMPQHATWKSLFLT